MEKPQNLLPALYSTQVLSASEPRAGIALSPRNQSQASSVFAGTLPACTHWAYIPQREDLCLESCACPAHGLQGKGDVTQLSLWDVRVWGDTCSMDVLTFFFSSQRGSQHPARGGGD